MPTHPFRLVYSEYDTTAAFFAGTAASKYYNRMMISTSKKSSRHYASHCSVEKTKQQGRRLGINRFIVSYDVVQSGV